GVQRVETMPFVFNIRSICERETHSSKNLDRALPHLRQWMQRANLMWGSRKRDVDRRKRFGFFFSTYFFSALVKRCRHGVARQVEQFTDDRAFLFGERFHPLAPFGDVAAFSEIFYPDAFKRFLVARRFNLAQRVVAKLFERMHGFRESLNRYIVKSEIDSRISIYESRRFLFRFRFVFQRALCLIDYRFECGFVSDREIGENFAVQPNTGSFQPFGQAAVSHAIGACGGVETLDPSITKRACSR